VTLVDAYWSQARATLVGVLALVAVAAVDLVVGHRRLSVTVLVAATAAAAGADDVAQSAE